MDTNREIEIYETARERGLPRRIEWPLQLDFSNFQHGHGPAAGERLEMLLWVDFAEDGSPILYYLGRLDDDRNHYCPFKAGGAGTSLEEAIEEAKERVRKRNIKATLRPVRELAEKDNEWLNSYSGMAALMDRNDVPKRTRSGSIRSKGARGRVYVSVYELQEKSNTSG